MLCQFFLIKNSKHLSLYKLIHIKTREHVTVLSWDTGMLYIISNFTLMSKLSFLSIFTLFHH